jgi:hypothetical protein
MNIHTQSQGRLLGADKSGSGLQHAAQSIAAIIAFIVFAFAWSWGLGFVASQIKPQSILVSTAVLMVSGFGPSIRAWLAAIEALPGFTAMAVNRVGLSA